MRGRKVFKTLVDPGLAVGSLLNITGETLFRRLMEDTAIVRIEESLGRLLASNVYSPIDLPYYPRSLVDGCAVRSIDTKHADESHPVSLTYSGLVHVGEKPSISVKPGSCVEVDTGAWIPLGADAVVPIEYVEIENDRAILTRSGGVWMNIALPSTDIGKGDLVASKGTLVTPQIASSIASVGIGEVRVTRRIRVSVGSTGDELVEPGSRLEEGKIFNSNRSYLITRLKELGADVLDQGIIRDDLEQITDALSKASEKSDIIVFTGGTSAGPEDVLYKAVEKIGKILFHGLKIKPGKPTIIGVINDKPFFGLPGNPRSAVNVFEKIVEKFLYELGLTLEPSCSSKELTLPVTIYGTRGRTTYIPVAIDGEYAWPVARDSYMIASYAWSDGLIEIPSNAYAPLTKGTKVRVAIKRKPVTTIYALTDIAEWDKYSSLIEDNIGTFQYRILSLSKDQLDTDLIGHMNYIVAPKDVMQEEFSSRKIVYLGSRSLVKLEKTGKCNYSGIRAGYGFLEKYVDGTLLYHPRFQGLSSLFKKGYLDCTILPSDFIDQDQELQKYAAEKIGNEELVLVLPEKNSL